MTKPFDSGELLQKIQEHKEFKPDSKVVDALKMINKSFQPGKKKKPEEPELSTEEKLDRRRSEDDFDRAIKEGEKNE